MAQRALMLGVNFVYKNNDVPETMDWEINWEFLDWDGGITEHYRNITPIGWADSGATIVQKIVDKIVADALAERGYVIARTSVLLVSYQRGS